MDTYRYEILPSLNRKTASVRMDNPHDSMGVLLGNSSGSTYRIAVCRAIEQAMRNGSFRKGQNLTVKIILG